MTLTINPTKFKHLGQYRSVPDGQGAMRLISWREAVIDQRVLKRLFKYGPVTRGILHSNLGGHHQTIEEVTASLVRLEDWGMVELSAGTRVDSVRVLLTGNGEYWASQLIAEDDHQNAIEAQERVRAAGRAQAE